MEEDIKTPLSQSADCSDNCVDRTEKECPNKEGCPDKEGSSNKEGRSDRSDKEKEGIKPRESSVRSDDGKTRTFDPQKTRFTPFKSDGNKPGFKRSSGDRRDFRKKFTPIDNDGIETTVLSFRRVSKTTAGGRKMRISVLVVAGDKAGKVGIGTGKAKDSFSAIKKGESNARKNMMIVPMFEKRAIRHDICEDFGALKVLLKKAYKGRGIGARGTAKKIFELVGIKDIVCKCIGNHSSSHNVAYGIIKCFESLKSMADIHTYLKKEG